MNQTEIVHQPKQAVDRQPPSVAEMLQTFMAKGVTAENVAVMEQLVGLYERMEAKNAEKAFNSAFVALQHEMPNVKAMQPVPNNDGTIRYTFAPYEDIMEQVQPFLNRHGFTISFSTKYDTTRVVKVCTLRHTSGHSVTNEFAVRIGKGPPGSSEAQADGAAGTYAKRMALADALNIVVEKDSDARIEGGKISNQNAAALRKRVKATGSDEAAFLRYAQSPIADSATDADVVAAYESIPESMFRQLDESLKKKERTK